MSRLTAEAFPTETPPNYPGNTSSIPLFPRNPLFPPPKLHHLLRQGYGGQEGFDRQADRDLRLFPEPPAKSNFHLATVLTLSQRLDWDDATLNSAKGGNRRRVSGFRLNMLSKRHIHYVLARMTAFIESGCDKGDHFAADADRLPNSSKNPYLRSVERLKELKAGVLRGILHELIQC